MLEMARREHCKALAAADFAARVVRHGQPDRGDRGGAARGRCVTARLTGHQGRSGATAAGLYVPLDPKTLHPFYIPNAELFFSEWCLLALAEKLSVYWLRAEFLRLIVIYEISALIISIVLNLIVFLRQCPPLLKIASGTLVLVLRCTNGRAETESSLRVADFIDGLEIVTKISAGQRVASGTYTLTLSE
jgi:hypothetical protein